MVVPPRPDPVAVVVVVVDPDGPTGVVVVDDPGPVVDVLVVVVVVVELPGVDPWTVVVVEFGTVGCVVVDVDFGVVVVVVVVLTGTAPGRKYSLPSAPLSRAPPLTGVEL